MLRLERLLAPLGYLHGAGAALRRVAYDRGLFESVAAPVPVISVGGLTMGGSGKTPVVGLLARELRARGWRVGVVHGGFRGRERGRCQRISAQARWEPGAALRLGDEAVLLAGWLADGIVIGGRDKAAGARLAAEQGAEIVVVDDGFGHRRLRRDLEVVLEEAVAELPLPAGRGRELPSAIRRADLRWRHHRDGGRPTGASGMPPRVVSRNLPRHLLAWDGGLAGVAADLRGRRVFLLTGVARPAAFAALVRGLGAEVVGHIAGGDHRIFTRQALRCAARSRADLVLCTEKDAARLTGDPGCRWLCALTCSVEILAGRALLERQLDRLREAR